MKYGGMKDHDIYTQARCRVRGWELHESDMQMLQENMDPEVILQNMPKRIFLKWSLKTFLAMTISLNIGCLYLRRRQSGILIKRRRLRG